MSEYSENKTSIRPGRTQRSVPLRQRTKVQEVSRRRKADALWLAVLGSTRAALLSGSDRYDHFPFWEAPVPRFYREVIVTVWVRPPAAIVNTLLAADVGPIRRFTVRSEERRV